MDRFGIVHDGTSGVATSNPFLRRVVLGLCTGSRPYPIGRNEAVAARSDYDLLHFLSDVFAKPDSPGSGNG